MPPRLVDALPGTRLSAQRQPVVHTKDGERTAQGSIQLKDAERLGINYDGLIPVLIKSIQEQQVLIQSQASRMAALEQRLVALEQGP